jgi:hypothetical protein
LCVAFQHDDLLEMIGKCTCGRHTVDTGAENNGPLADKMRCHPSPLAVDARDAERRLYFSYNGSQTSSEASHGEDPAAMTDEPLIDAVALIEPHEAIWARAEAKWRGPPPLAMDPIVARLFVERGMDTNQKLNDWCTKMGMTRGCRPCCRRWR